VTAAPGAHECLSPSRLDFDLAKVIEQSRDNPVFYMRIAHARARSAMRHVKLLARWPRLVESAADAHEPHRVASYLYDVYDVAAAFHGLWNKGEDDASLRFLIATDAALTAARLALVQATATIIASGLEIMGVEPVEEMR
jgi:arginyl-tRNA synthetase